MIRRILLSATAAALVVAPAAQVLADTPASTLRHFEAAAGAKGSAERGGALFTSTHSGGKPDTPSCLTCHTSNLHGTGMTRAGKVIPPMAVSSNPERFTDLKKTEKWFRRNCNSVLGRECSLNEKADIVAYLMSL